MDLEHKEHGDIDVISVIGELDLYGAPTLQEKVDKLKSIGRTKIIFDLGKVPYMDSSGLAVFLKTMVNKKIPYPFANINSGIQHIFQMSGYKQATTVYNTVEEAIKSF